MPNQVHVDIFSLLLLLGAFQGVFFAILLFFMNHQRRQINQHMSIILFSFGLLIFHLFLVESGYIYKLQFLTGFALPFDVLAGPSIYCYIR